jgi:tetratricopeptide (TPR) repeat protein
MNQATLLNEHGHSLWSSGNLDGAQQKFEQLLKVAQHGECETLEATAWNNLAVVFRDRGELARAAACQQQAWRAALNGFPDDSGSDLLSENLTNLANDAILAGNYELARRLLRSALEIDVRAGNSAGEAADWGNLGVIAYLTGQLDQARRDFARARQLHQQVGDDRGLGCDLGHFGQLSLAEGDFAGARGFIEQSLSHFERAGCRHLAQQAHRTLREIAARQRVAEFDPVRN